MPSTYTPNLGVEKPEDGEQDGIWGDVVNLNMDILDRAINGTVSITLSGTSSTITTSDGVLSNGQYKLLALAGTPSGTHTITIAPNDAAKIYFVSNASTQNVVFTQGSGGTATVAAGDTAIICAFGTGPTSGVTNITDFFGMNSANITGGTINGTVIGGTTAAAGTFTTGTFSSNVGVGTTNPLERLHVNTATGAAGIRISVADVSYGNLFSSVSGTSLNSINAAPLTFGTTNIERMRIDAAGNVGVGLTNPAVNLDVGGTVSPAIRAVSTTNNVDTRLTSFGGVNVGISGTFSNHRFALFSNALERLSVHTSGGVSIGNLVDPGAKNLSVTGDLYLPALTTETRSLEVGNQRSGDGNSLIDLVGDATYTDYGVRLIRNGGQNGITALQHRGTGSLLLLAQEAAPIVFSTTNTERMRITATGNVGVGTATPTDFGVNYQTAQVNGTNGGVFRASNTAATVVGDFYADTGAVGVRTATSVPLAFQTNSVEHARIHVSGGVSIGNLVDPGDNNLSVTGTVQTSLGTAALPSHTFIGDTNTGIWSPAADTVAVSTNGAEAARIHTSGGVSIGNTTDPGATNLSVTGAVRSATSLLSSGAGGVGYSTGAGVAVTQLTSRTTPVPTTGNKTSGAITLFTTTAVVGTWFSFTVPNTAIAITDTVSLTVRGATNSYLAYVTAIVAGTSFTVTMASVVGTASDTPIVNFNIIRGVSA